MFSKLCIKSFLLTLTLSAGFGLAQTDPLLVLKKKDSELQQTLRKNSKSTAEIRAKEIKTLINSIFDFEELGRKALGDARYLALKPEEQKKFIAAFKDMIENSSLRQLELYKTDSTVYEPTKLLAGGKKATVTAQAWSKGQKSVLVYRLFQKNNDWKAWDLVIDDLSTYTNYREQFGKILKTKNIAQLTEILEKKAAASLKEFISKNPST